MRVIIEKDNGEKEVLQYVEDVYVAVRQKRIVGEASAKPYSIQRFVTETRSYSWGSNVRELVKELQQSLVELQDFLREQRRGGSG